MSIKVKIIESEKGWGQKVISIEEHENYEKAIARVREFNKDLGKELMTPEVYHYAELEMGDSHKY